MAVLTKMPERPARVIDPNAPIEQQHAALMSLIADPPQNSRPVTFSPGLSTWILENLNGNNRNKRPAKIKIFAEAMSEKAWRLTGDTVKFDKRGALLDGQNRLSACVFSGAAFTTHAIFGIDPNAFNVIDTNSVRTNGDTFKIGGVKNAGVVSGAMRWLAIYKSGDETNRSLSFDNATLYALYKTFDEKALSAAASYAMAVKVLPRGALAAHIYMFLKKDTKTADIFARDLAKGARGAGKLIEKVMALKTQQMGRLHEVHVNALTIIAWNAYRSKKNVTATMLKWTETNDYPTIK